MRAQGAAAALQAVGAYDRSRGVPFSAFVRQRVMSGAFTRYRREWRYAIRCVSPPDESEHGSVTRDSSCSAGVLESLRFALSRLTELDKRVIEQLFWEGNTEAEIAQRLGISQQAVSRRKKLILHDLRLDLRTAGKNLR